MPVEAPGPAQRAVDVPGVVRRGEDEDAFVAAVDAVEFGKEGLNDAAQAAAAKVGALVADGVDLVQEEHARRVAARRVEDRAQLALALADVHVEHVDEADRVEAGAELAGDGTGDEGLPATRGAVEQQPAAQALAVQAAQLGIAHRHEERAFQPLLDLLHAGDIGQPNPGLLDIAGRAAIGVVAVDEHRRHDAFEGLLGLAPVERAVVSLRGDRLSSARVGRGSGLVGLRLLRGLALEGFRRGGHQPMRTGVARIGPHDRGRFRECLDGLARLQQQLAVVQP